MDSLVQDGIYKKITVLDNQGACHSGIEPGTDSASALRVIRLMDKISNAFMCSLFHFDLI